jgi:hypothetical protein
MPTDGGGWTGRGRYRHVSQGLQGTCPQYPRMSCQCLQQSCVPVDQAIPDLVPDIHLSLGSGKHLHDSCGCSVYSAEKACSS